MNSALYSGWIAHRRFSPRAHQFRYRIGLLYLDLDEQQAVFGLSRLSGLSRFAPFSFRETDYLKSFTGRGIRLIDAVRQQVGEAIGHVPQGSICLLTQPRSWGLSFNPVSFSIAMRPTANWRRSSAKSATPLGASATTTCCPPRHPKIYRISINTSLCPKPFMSRRFYRVISSTA